MKLLRAMVLSALTTLGLGLVVLIAPAAPAWACSCVGGDEDARADLIVVGTVAEVSDREIRLAVESVEKGSAGGAATLRLAVGRYESSCGYDFRVGARYRVNSSDGATGLCVGIRRLPAAPTTPAALSPAAEFPDPITARPEPTRLSVWWWLAPGGVLIAVAAGLMAVAVRRRRSG